MSLPLLFQILGMRDGGSLTAKREKRMYEPPKKDYGDIVPAMLTPGEVVLPLKTAKLVADAVNTRVTPIYRRDPRDKIAKVMREFKKGKLHIGKSKKLVKDRKQAVAIALSEADK